MDAPKGYCGLGLIRTEGTTTIFELQLTGGQPKGRTEWKLHNIKKQTPINRKLKRACLKLRELLVTREIVEGTIGIGGSQPNTLEIKFSNETIQDSMMKVILILHQELDQ